MSNKAKFKWDDQLTDYAKGDLDNFQRGWEEVDEVYYPLNIGLSLGSCADISSYAYAHEGVANRDDLDLTTMTKPRDFDVRRLPLDAVPQTAKSGDYGVFVVKYLECLLADIPVSNIVDDVMQHSRDKLYVDLFYQNIEL
ncbi:Ulp1 protease family, C-terminal catalytic domain containing protein [Trema orientale]|uniref:Ulp1 protease family, C-terminal catalytic domain containing protein n=1 Tax=Trema orientale TaxID=63057 RepID=A0A2P5F911_TREOI|nr:Ulp1 protease family, C-terminal catalytic domain containing protein [Trema orientale]